MKKFLSALAICLAVTVLPALAALGNAITWVDGIPGLKLIDSVQTEFKVEKTYNMDNPQKNYDRLMKELKKNGWRIVEKENEDDTPGMPSVKAVKDNMKLEIEPDRRDDGSHKLEIELKKY